MIEDDPTPWYCGVCGEQNDSCACGEPLALIIRVPGCIASEIDHDTAARQLVAMLNDQRVMNYGGEEGHGPAPIRLLYSGWAEPVSDDTARNQVGRRAYEALRQDMLASLHPHDR